MRVVIDLEPGVIGFRVTVAGKSGHPIVLNVCRWPGHSHVLGAGFVEHMPGENECDIHTDERCEVRDVIRGSALHALFSTAQLTLGFEPSAIVASLLKKHAAGWNPEMCLALLKTFKTFMELAFPKEE